MRAVILMSGLPASGKTTAAMRLHAALGGTLIRSCDIYRELGIVLSEWVERTQRFTVDVDAYDRVRDDAYAEMARRVDLSLAAGASPAIVDAVHGERDKRSRLYDICRARRAAPILVVCCCEDFEEVQRRFRTRRGREREPQHEASDLSVFRDISRRWQAPLQDVLPDGTCPTVLTYDSLTNRAEVAHFALSQVAERPMRLFLLRMKSAICAGGRVHHLLTPSPTNAR